MFRDFHTNAGYLRIIREKVLDQDGSELLDAPDVVLAREHVNGVLDGVGGQDLAVVAGFVAAFEVALEKNLKRQLVEVDRNAAPA
jgi:hypothetical protein